MTLAEKERQALADLLLSVGPAAPTRCEGWLTRDLLLHLLIRERRPDAVPGTFSSFGRSWTRRVAAGYRMRPWSEQVEIFRTRPGLPNPIHFARVDDLVNSGELFIHHEDVRRGRPGWEVRDYDPQTAAALDTMVRSKLLALQLRKAGVGVRARLPGGELVDLRSGDPVVEVAGEPGEIVLFASGRPAARVHLSGPPAALEAFGRGGFTVDERL